MFGGLIDIRSTDKGSLTPYRGYNQSESRNGGWDPACYQSEGLQPSTDFTSQSPPLTARPPVTKATSPPTLGSAPSYAKTDQEALLTKGEVLPIGQQSVSPQQHSNSDSRPIPHYLSQETMEINHLARQPTDRKQYGVKRGTNWLQPGRYPNSE